MLRRSQQLMLEKALRRQAAVAIVGPRQVGKTTLALSQSENRELVYLDLEDPDDRRKLDNPALFFSQYEDKLVVLDEIHRMPDLFPVLRGVIDRGRRAGKGKGRFLVLGSASLDLLKQSGESLAGRIAHLNLLPFSLTEIEGGQDELMKLWLRGGFPEAYLATGDAESFEIRRDFVQSYLDRDVPMFGPRVPAETMRRLWTMLAHNQGQQLNVSKLAASLPSSATSVGRYIDLLVDLLLIRRLQPWAHNLRKRVTKAPKVYIRDSGLVHCLLGIRDVSGLLGHPVVGASWECLVIESLINACPEGVDFSYYRSSGGAEIDLILTHPGGERWAIEVKLAKVPKESRGFYSALDDVRPARAFVVHSGEDRFMPKEDVEAIGLRDMLSEVKAWTEEN